MCRVHCFSSVHALFTLTSRNAHVILSAAHFSVPSCSSFSYLFLYHSFFEKPWVLYHLLHPIHLTPAHPSVSLLFDVSLILSRLSTMVISSIFQCYSCSSCSLYMPSFPSHSGHPFVSVVCSRHARIHYPLSLPTSLFRVCNLSHFLTSSISH